MYFVGHKKQNPSDPVRQADRRGLKNKLAALALTFAHLHNAGDTDDNRPCNSDKVRTQDAEFAQEEEEGKYNGQNREHVMVRTLAHTPFLSHHLLIHGTK